tara:strand:+ start:41158 stop:41301 length:144 start_codon:yes stop_codon:yes gene_type:complete
MIVAHKVVLNSKESTESLKNSLNYKHFHTDILIFEKLQAKFFVSCIK